MGLLVSPCVSLITDQQTDSQTNYKTSRVTLTEHACQGDMLLYNLLCVIITMHCFTPALYILSGFEICLSKLNKKLRVYKWLCNFEPFFMYMYFFDHVQTDIGVGSD